MGKHTLEESLAAQEKIGAKIERNDQGEVVEVGLREIQITDAGLVHLKGLANLQILNLYNTQITDAGIAQLAGMNLKILDIPNQARTDIGLKHYLAVVEPPTDLSLFGWKVTDDDFERAAHK